jgi:hypothetical protein
MGGSGDRGVGGSEVEVASEGGGLKIASFNGLTHDATNEHDVQARMPGYLERGSQQSFSSSFHARSPGVSPFAGGARILFTSLEIQG